MKRKLVAAVAALSATAAAPAVAHAAPPAQRAAAHCVYVGPVYVLNRLILGVYEICEPV